MTLNNKTPGKGMAVGSEPWKRCVAEGLSSLSVTASPGQVDRLAVHSREMLLWNRTSNLTAITDPLEVAVKHVIDSGAAVPYISEDASVLDLGSGGGYPGIPLKILRPKITLTLVDASRKKVSFLKQVIRTLDLSDTTAVHARGEELGQDAGQRARYDVVISRAFSGIDRFIPMAWPFLKPGGAVIAMKGREMEQEQTLFESVCFMGADNREIRSEHLDLTVISYNLPVLGSERSILIVRLKK
jgi:16S rRNA (guanine527-N7)-methyltransferase